MRNIKFIVSALLILTVGCSKEDSVLDFENIEDQKEFWVEEGVLHLKNREVLDSLSFVVGVMTDEERIAWENSLGYNSYESLYRFIFSEYEKMVEQVDEVGSDEPYFGFRELYSGLAIFPDEKIEGEENRTIEPKVTLYSCLANEEGKLVVGNQDIEEFSTVLLKSGALEYTCTKTHARRRMGAKVWMGPNTYPTINVYLCQKKRFGGWWSYSSVFYVETNASPYRTSFSASAGGWFYLHQHTGATRLKIWNDGVGEPRHCEFIY